MLLPAGEPLAEPLRLVEVARFTALLLEGAELAVGRPWLIAVDGRSGAGKSTLTRRLLPHLGPAAVVRTDDLAWHEPFFGWGHLLTTHVLEPLHRGEAVSFRPPAWAARGRPGQVEVPAGLRAVVVEGTGADQRAHSPLLDRTVWVQSDRQAAEERGIARDVAEGVNGDPEQSRRFWHEWMAHELPFFATERPWERADAVVCGTPGSVDAEPTPDAVLWAPGPLTSPLTPAPPP